VFGEELAAIGLHVDLAPVADANTNPENSIIGMRSFGERPDLVARHVRAAIAGLHDGGAGAAAKHFQGHGDTRVDSHRHLPVVDRPRAVLEDNELLPFRAAVAAGADIVMTSHIFFPALDRTWPATLSGAILTGLLRGEMGFPGVILTDSFNMGSMRCTYDPVEAAVEAVRAGADMIMLAEERYDEEREAYLSDQRHLVTGLVSAVRGGKVEASRIDDAVSRILALKGKRARPPRPRTAEEAARVVGSAEHRDVEQRAAEAAIVLVQDRRRLVPLRLKPEERILIASATDPEGYRRMDAGRGIGPNIVERPAQIALREITRRHSHTVATSAPPADLEAILSEAAEAAAVVVVTEKYPLAGFDFPDESQHLLVAALVGARLAPVVILGCRDPYELAHIPDVDVYISAMGYRAASVAAAVRVLFGEVRPQGTLPVSIPGLYPAGWSVSVP
jgi:beta-N-acetylhexosaminidase